MYNTADGEHIDKFIGYSKLLGKLLEAASVDLSKHGVNIQQLTDGTSSHTFEELQFILAKDSATCALSENLQEKLWASK